MHFKNKELNGVGRFTVLLVSSSQLGIARSGGLKIPRIFPVPQKLQRKTVDHLTHLLLS